MLYTLFSPSEGKRTGGKNKPMHDMLFGLAQRNTILQKYNAIVNSGDMPQIKALVGIKKDADVVTYQVDIFSQPVMPAIERYSGVAYEYLDYHTLTDEQQKYLKTNTIIFSNLYGPLTGGDNIANYKVKQGNRIVDIATETFYREAFSVQIDNLLHNHEILDLRAGYYEKFYKMTQPYTTLKFIKNGKVLSHWAKAYRGIVLRHLAEHNVTSIEQYLKINIQGLMLKEIKKIKLKTEIVYDIVQ